MQLTFCAEFLDYQELLRDEVIKLIKRYNLKICLAVGKKKLKKALPLLKRFQKEGIEFILWPVLAWEGDYWPSERNIEEFSLLLDGMLNALKKEKIRVKEIAVDLEPSRRQLVSIQRGNPAGWKYAYLLAKTRVKENMNIGRYWQAIKKLNKLIERLHSCGIKVITSCSSDFVLEDLWLFGGNAVQDFQEAPLFKVNWDEINIQFYNSAIQGYLNILSQKTLTRTLYDLANWAKRKLKTDFSLALGTIDLEDKTSWVNYKSAEEFLPDIQAALAAGVEEILIYSLDGLLRLKKPNEVLDKLFAQKPKIPPLTFGSIAYRITRIFLRALLELISIPRLFKK